MPSENNLRISFLAVGNGDCALIQFNSGQYSILVDSGPSRSTVAQRTVSQLKQLLPNSKPVDLAILTHHDDDHIGGFLEFFRSNDIPIHQALFNSPALLAALLANDDPQEISVKQARLLQDMKAPCNTHVICSGETIKVFGGKAELRILTPWKRDILQYGRSILEELTPPQPISVKKPFRRIDEVLSGVDTFEQDSSKSNLLSISFILNYIGRSWLFLADAWPSRVVRALKTIDASNSPEFALTKIAHHGSQGNTDKQLAELLRCSDFVVPAAGGRHPDEQVFGRIVAGTGNRRARFHFPEKTPDLARLTAESDFCFQFPDNGRMLDFYYDDIEK
ncbi:MBL fold metallo-hydrolase [Achromobacter spanius]|uniref:ComEC/Rec2 family competence protein n=1 Tax=Achromobacter spanius TaxID=217203 RepID=UPI003208C6F3